MKPGLRSLFLLPLLAACGTVRHWRELQTEPMTLGACYDGFVAVVTARDGFRADASATDRGMGTWQSTWKKRQMERHFPMRSRLRAEILVDDGSAETGCTSRYMSEQEKVKYLRPRADPREEDWSADGQDEEAEAILGERLVRRLAPKSVRLGKPQQPAR